jgi:flagellar L-ring protein FlgH
MLNRSGLIVLLLLCGCNTTERLKNVGKTPELNQVTNPTQTPGYRPVSLPMPESNTAARNPNSLWQAGRKSFFKDQRASQIGDSID